MSASGAEDCDGAGPNGPLPAEPAGGRVWQACLACRRKKIKCDGKQPCHNCSSRNQTCEFPGTKDNASASRYYNTTFEARCQKMDALCERLEVLTRQLSRSLGSMHRTSRAGSIARQSEDLMIATQLLNSFHSVDNTGTTLADTTDRMQAAAPLHVSQSYVNDDVDGSSGSESDTTDDERRCEKANERKSEHVSQAGALVRDSYGRPRFIGGATHSTLMEAAKSLPPAGFTATPTSTGASQSALSTEDLELPLFVPGKVWPEMPFIPKAEDIPRPPQYIADLLISLYFDKIHYTFPVLFRPHFMRRYQKLLKVGRDCSSPKHRRHLMVFFAVCACSSSLLPSNTGDALPGVDYYQKALLVFYASTGEASLERVQCLALLSMCSAGWNTLSQSWNLAGQAVRAAQDMGLHLSSRSILSLLPELSENTDSDSEFLRLEVSRRIWWCVYTLDRITSICLGRPMAIQDDDCNCELPSDKKDQDFEPQYMESKLHHSLTAEIQPEDPSILSGFLAFARLSRLAGKIHHLNSPSNLRKLASTDPEKTQKFLARVDKYDQALRTWLASLPPRIQFSANSTQKRPGGDPDLVMCVVTFVLHAGSLLSLYRCFLNYPRKVALEEQLDISGAISQCVSAAQMCIHAAEIIQDLVPTSHYLAMAAHYMTLSGIVLLRVPLSHWNPDFINDVEKCITFLKDIEVRWSGAMRSRIIIEQLLQDQRRKMPPERSAARIQSSVSPALAKRVSNKRALDDLEVATTPRAAGNSQWGEMPGSGSFPFDALDPVLFSHWD